MHAHHGTKFKQRLEVAISTTHYMGHKTLACLNACKNKWKEVKWQDQHQLYVSSCQLTHVYRRPAQHIKRKILQQKSHLCICHRNVIPVHRSNQSVQVIHPKATKVTSPIFCMIQTVNVGFTNIVDFYQNLQIWIFSALTQCQQYKHREAIGNL